MTGVDLQFPGLAEVLDDVEEGKKDQAHSFCCSNLIMKVIIRAIRKPTFGSKKSGCQRQDIQDKIMPQKLSNEFFS